MKLSLILAIISLTISIPNVCFSFYKLGILHERKENLLSK